MVKKYTANLSNWLKSKLNSIASNSKMNGTQSAGVSDLIARADHVHPVDTSRAPTSHASSDTTYGVGSASNYGHVKVDSSPTDSSSNAVASGGVKTVLDTKQNEVETQAKITSFTNKDRINIERLINYMENGDSDNYYTLDLKGARGNLSGDAGDAYFNNSTSVTFSDDKDRLAVTNSDSWLGVGAHFVLGGMIYKNGLAQTSNTSKITFKLIDGTVIGESIYKLKDDSRNQSMRNYNYYFENWSDSQVVWSPGIYYVYAEATINDSVIRSQILTVFVKDTNNLLEYNQWSGTDYTKDITGITSLNNSIIESVNKWSDIGENSFKLTRTDNSLTTVCRMNITNLTIGSNITLKLTTYNTNSNITIRLMDDNTIISDVVVPKSDTSTIVSLSGDVTNTTLIMRVILSNNNSYCYLDNISVIKN